MSSIPFASFNNVPKLEELVSALLADPEAKSALQESFPEKSDEEIQAHLQAALYDLDDTTLAAVVDLVGPDNFSMKADILPSTGLRCFLRGIRCVGQTLVLSYARSGGNGYLDVRVAGSAICANAAPIEEEVEAPAPSLPPYPEPATWPSQDTMVGINPITFALGTYRSDDEVRWTPATISDAPAVTGRAASTSLATNSFTGFKTEGYLLGETIEGPIVVQGIGVDHHFISNSVYDAEATRLYGEVPNDGTLVEVANGAYRFITAEENSTTIKTAYSTYALANKTLVYEKKIDQETYTLDIDLTSSVVNRTPSIGGVAAEPTLRSNNVVWLGLKKNANGTFRGGIPIAFGTIPETGKFGPKDPSYTALAMDPTHLNGLVKTPQVDMVYFTTYDSATNKMVPIGAYRAASTGTDSIPPEEVIRDGTMIATIAGSITAGASPETVIDTETGNLKPGVAIIPKHERTQLRFEVSRTEESTLVSVYVYGTYGSTSGGQWNKVAQVVGALDLDLTGYVALDITNRDKIENIGLASAFPQTMISKLSLDEEKFTTPTPKRLRIFAERDITIEQIFNGTNKDVEASQGHLDAFVQSPSAMAVAAHSFIFSAGGYTGERNATTAKDLTGTFLLTTNDMSGTELYDITVRVGEPQRASYWKKINAIQAANPSIERGTYYANQASTIPMALLDQPLGEEYEGSHLARMHQGFASSDIVYSSDQFSGRGAVMVNLRPDQTLWDYAQAGSSDDPLVIPFHIVVGNSFQPSAPQGSYYIFLSFNPASQLYTCWSALDAGKGLPAAPALPAKPGLTSELITTSNTGVAKTYVLNNKSVTLRSIFGSAMDNSLGDMTPVTDAFYAFAAGVKKADLATKFTDTQGSYFEPRIGETNVANGNLSNTLIFAIEAENLRNIGNDLVISFGALIEEQYLYSDIGYSNNESPTAATGYTTPNNKLTRLNYYRFGDGLPDPMAQAAISFAGPTRRLWRLSDDGSVVVFALLMNQSINSNVVTGNPGQYVYQFKNYAMPVRLEAVCNGTVASTVYATLSFNPYNQRSTAWLTPHTNPSFVIPYNATATISKTNPQIGTDTTLATNLTVFRFSDLYTPGTVTWTSSDPTVATVNSSGVVTLLKAGTFHLNVSEAGKWSTTTDTVTVAP